MGPFAKQVLRYYAFPLDQILLGPRSVAAFGCELTLGSGTAHFHRIFVADIPTDPVDLKMHIGKKLSSTNDLSHHPEIDH